MALRDSAPRSPRGIERGPAPDLGVTARATMGSRGARITLGLVLAGVTAAVGACVLVEPPADVPPPAGGPPVILQDQVVPSTTEVLESWPLEFIVPVEVPDTTVALHYQVFLDGDYGSPYVRPQELDPVGDAGVRTIYASLAAPALDACHTLEIAVAYQFDGLQVPEPPGGDSITWFYAPNGSLEGCPVYDAGPAASVDASEGGDDGAVP